MWEEGLVPEEMRDTWRHIVVSSLSWKTFAPPLAYSSVCQDWTWRNWHSQQRDKWHRRWRYGHSGTTLPGVGSTMSETTAQPSARTVLVHSHLVALGFNSVRDSTRDLSSAQNLYRFTLCDIWSGKWASEWNKTTGWLSQMVSAEVFKTHSFKVWKEKSSKKAKPEVVARDLLHPKLPRISKKKCSHGEKKMKALLFKFPRDFHKEAMSHHMNVVCTWAQKSPSLQPLLIEFVLTAQRWASGESLRWNVPKVLETKPQLRQHSLRRSGAKCMMGPKTPTPSWGLLPSSRTNGHDWSPVVPFSHRHKSWDCYWENSIQAQFWTPAAHSWQDFFYSHFLTMFIVSQESAK